MKLVDIRRRVVLNHIGQIKWQWRAGIFFVLYLAGHVAVVSLVQTYQQLTGTPATIKDLPYVAEYALRAVLLLLLSWGCLHTLDKRRFGSLGLSFHVSWKKEFAFGLAAGSIIPASIWILLWSIGVVEVHVRALDVAGAIGGFVLNVLWWLGAAVYYELLFRGYILQSMSEGLGKIAGTIFVSFWYGAVQIQFGPGGIMAAVNYGMAGIMFSVIYFRTVSLWAPLGLHFAWNFVQAYVLGSPVTGMSGGSSVLVTSVQGAHWFGGSSFGIDSGVAGALVIAVFLYYVTQSRQLVVTDEMRKIKYEALTTPFVEVARPGNGTSR